MRILIIGNAPHDIGGVANYSRPLAIKFTQLGHNVFYLYSGAYNRKYNWFIMPYLVINRRNFPFECAEIINSPNLPFNFGIPELDLFSPNIEKIICRYLDKIKPDILHIHSRLGLPTSINEIAFQKGIKVLNTIHVYGYLCQKRVMIDKEGKLCVGPHDFLKCALCTGMLNLRKERLKARISAPKRYLKERNERIFNLLRKAKNFLHRKLSPPDTIIPITSTIKDRQKLLSLAKILEKRLQYNINVLNNYSHLNICVSMDVKKTLMSYGANEEKLIVQHIGSLIAERQKPSTKKVDSKKVVFANIGGLSYYKGTHILLDAFNGIKKRNFELHIYGRYNEAYISKLMRGKENLKVKFYGHYRPQELPTLISEVDVMVLASICNDTAPQTIFESYSARIPIIASNIGGFPDFIKDGINGLLFKPGDKKELAKKIDFILGHPDEIEKYRRNIPKLKTITENARELENLYLKLIKNSE